MASDNKTVYVGKENVCTLTFIVFLVLKLCGTITWSWWWVTAPLWIPFGLLIVIAFIVGIIYGIIQVFDKTDK
jgi:hypothetical protein